MSANDNEPQNSVIEPTFGILTEYIHPGKESDYSGSELVSFKLCRLMDGLTARRSGLWARNVMYIQATPKEYDQYPYVGLKIHVAVLWNDPSFLKIIEGIALLCESKNKDSRATMFKVMFPEDQEQSLKNGQLRGVKSITVYPRYFENEETNVPETVRLVANIKKLLEQRGYTEHGLSLSLSKTERRSAPGIYLRPGSLKDRGENFEGAGRDAPFESQLEGNLRSPGTDPIMFKKLVNEAISEGKL